MNKYYNGGNDDSGDSSLQASEVSGVVDIFGCSFGNRYLPGFLLDEVSGKV